MKIVDVKSFSELNTTVTDYWSLINHFSRFNASFYNDRNIYFERHHIYPKGDFNSKIIVIPITVCLPFKYHFLAHYYRALEHTDLRLKNKNYYACWSIVHQRQTGISIEQNVADIASTFPNELYEARAKFLAYTSALGKDLEVHYKRSVICLNTMKIYVSVLEAARDTKRTNVGASCRGIRSDNGLFFSYYDPLKGIPFYKNLYEQRILLDSEDRRLSKKRKYFGISVSCLETGETYISLAAAARSLSTNIHDLKNAVLKGTKLFGYHYKIL